MEAVEKCKKSTDVMVNKAISDSDAIELKNQSLVSSQNAVFNPMFATVQQVIDSIKSGEMVILLDDNDRENEGDLVFPASTITAKDINFMLKYGRGVICLAIHPTISQRLNIELQHRHNSLPNDPMFTVSIEAAEGITTGVSAEDRAHTIRVAASEKSSPDDIRTPGHVFPIISHPNGLNGRIGHTEASVELMKMAGLSKAAVICEVLDDNGNAAKGDDLMRFAQEHNIKICTVDMLKKYQNL